MNKSLLLSLVLFLAATSLFAQSLNTTLRSRVQYSENLNDIWGYVAPDGTEYALVGKRNGVSIVSLADPDNAVEVASIPGQASTWRDLKTYGEYAYVVTDQGGSTEGITIIDLTNLPASVTFTQGPRAIPGAGTFNKAHNIFIDETTGIAYIAGADANNGGMILYDVATTPGEATFLALAPPNYAHDVYVQDGRMYASEIFTGDLGIYDVSDPLNIIELSATETPFAFTHNAWTTADLNYVFTTDERANAPIGCYDISDEANPVLLDEFRPVRSVGSGVIPHNVHVLNEYLSISYYTDGLEIADASVADNVIEVAYYDTWQGGNGGFNGSWGAYPFLPSGLTLVTDITNGLFVIDVNYVRAARLKGVITDSFDGSVLNGVTANLVSSEASLTMTDAAGKYATGLATAGTYNVIFSKPGYEDLTVSVDLENGLEVVLDTFLTSNVERFAVTANVIASDDQNGISNAEVVLIGETGTFTAMTDENGVADFGVLFAGTYEAYAGKWGFRNLFLPAITVASNEAQTIELDRGYLDGFVLDQGWTASNSASATSGFWVRETPNGTFFGGLPSAPGFDAGSTTDIGDVAYVTGNLPGADNAGADDVDGGVVTLTSPIFDATTLANAVVSYQYWFFNAGGNPPTNDYLRVEISNGSETVTLAEYTQSTGAWLVDSFAIAEFITPSATMRMIVTTEDQNNTGHLVEGGFDDFEVRGSVISATENVALAGLEASVFPNPSSTQFVLNYRLPTTPRSSVELTVTDQLGRTVETRLVALDVTGTLAVGETLPAGLYYARLLVDGQVAYITKLVKH